MWPRGGADPIDGASKAFVQSFAEAVRHELADTGVELASDTDTEVLAHLIGEHYEKTKATPPGDASRDSHPLVQAVVRALQDVVENGTGQRAKIDGFDVGGKTGTAENAEGADDHGWFIGFAYNDKGEAVSAVCVMLENVGGGHASGQLGWLHFGLGNAADAEVRVIWPGGTADDWQRLDADRLYFVEREKPAREWTPN